MVIAVLEAHGGLKLGSYDVYLNVAGGLKVVEPAADAAAAAALVSSLSATPLPADRVYMGEIGLTGALRPIGQIAARLKEAAKLGFASALVPKAGLEAAGQSPLALAAVSDASGLVAGIVAPSSRGRGQSGAKDA
jgi:DNA repair protein RadA/Sms